MQASSTEYHQHASSAYVTDPSKGIAERLRAEGVLTAERFVMLSTMVDEAIEAHGGDVSQTMQSLGGERALYRSLGGSLVVDREGQISIDPDVTRGADTEGGSGEDSTRVTAEAPGRYRLAGEAEIGRGGIGRVLVAFDEHVGRQVAIKELLSDASRPLPATPSDGLTKSSALAARFLREARITGQLEHPNIMPVYEVGRREDGSYYYTMKLVRGRTLSAALAECRSLSDRLELLDHFVDLCNAVAYAHSRGVIHRDLEPDNAMLGEFGETVQVWRTEDGTRLHTFPVEEGFLAVVAFSLDSQRLSVTTNQGGISVWRIDRDRKAGDVLEQVGRASNQRACRVSFETVKIVPFPAPDQVWAPTELCR